MTADLLHIETVDPQGPDALALLHEAAVEARQLYPELFAPDSPPPTNPPNPPRGAYFVGYLADRPVACGALRPLDAFTVEVRRMYVLRSARRAGIARAVLSHLEKVAGELDYRTMRLETGYRQEPAIALYESYGFARIPCFGEHRNDPTSICFEKQVSVPS